MRSSSQSIARPKRSFARRSPPSLQRIRFVTFIIQEPDDFCPHHLDSFLSFFLLFFSTIAKKCRLRHNGTVTECRKRCAHPLAPSARGLRPQAVGERTIRLSEIFRAMARFSPSAPSGHLPRRGRFFDTLNTVKRQHDTLLGRLSKNSCRGEHCSPVPVYLVRMPSRKARCCAKLAGDQWSPLHSLYGKADVFRHADPFRKGQTL